MKIKSIKISAIRLPLKSPFVITYATYHDMPSIIVKIGTDNGLTGYGEAVPDQHVTGETWESTYATLTHNLAPILIGENPFDIERIHQLMAETLRGMPTAKAAIDIACYDLMGKAAGLPVYNLLGGKYHPLLTIPYVLSLRGTEEMASEAAYAVSQGYDSIKIKVGIDSKMDVQRIKAIRKAVGENVQLRVDANQGWKNRATTLSVLKHVEDCEIDWIEQPVIADNLQAIAEIRRSTTIPVMVDEGLCADKEMRQIISMQAADFINIKLMKCGGIYPALKLVNQAEIAGIECIIGSMIESSVATAAGAHLATSKKNIIANEMGGPLYFAKDVAELNYQKNRLLLTDKPGLGIVVDEEMIDELMIVTKSIKE